MNPGGDRGHENLLRRLSTGDPAAPEQLMPLVYDELRSIAARYLAAERAHHTLQPTALVHEVYLALVGDDRTWQGRVHFLAVAALSMRQLLVAHARKKNSAKRGGRWRRVTLSGVGESDGGPMDVDLVALDQALEELSRLEPVQGQVVELRYFGGLTIAETAAYLGIGETSVHKYWTAAKAWLKNRLRS
ncbi:MAG: ECF-type sigma factor [Acidobacteriota bacterium]